MGRLWLALALLTALGGSALADLPSYCVPPLTPVVRDASIELGDQVTSTGLYDVTRLDLEMQLDPITAAVRITLGAGTEATSVMAFPSHGQVSLVNPALRSHVGTVEIAIEPYARGCAGGAARKRVVAQRRRAQARNGLGAAGLLLVAPFLAALAFGLALVLLARIRNRSRAAIPPQPFSLPAAEHVARAVRTRAIAIVGLLAALAAYATSIATPAIAAIAFFVAPTVVVLALAAIVRWIDATRAVHLLRSEGATAEVRLDEVEISTTSRRVTLRASRWLVDRARRHALPRASL